MYWKFEYRKNERQISLILKEKTRKEGHFILTLKGNADQREKEEIHFREQEIWKKDGTNKKPKKCTKKKRKRKNRNEIGIR